ncbi:MAG: hypothetical protein WA198_12205 [Candidatus Sulfotelmatobacter sp.]
MFQELMPLLAQRTLIVTMSRASDDEIRSRFRITQTQEKEGGQAMSQSFRAVKEIWNAHSSCFIGPEKLTVLLHDLAARVGTASDEHDYGDNQVVWLEDGRKVLDYMEADKRFSAPVSKIVWKNKGSRLTGMI